jgi:hypothetical protein
LFLKSLKQTLDATSILCASLIKHNQSSALVFEKRF